MEADADHRIDVNVANIDFVIDHGDDAASA
jgi:hypothetical protein